jgi:hypothetical protein
MRFGKTNPIFPNIMIAVLERYPVIGKFLCAFGWRESGGTIPPTQATDGRLEIAHAAAIIRRRPMRSDRPRRFELLRRTSLLRDRSIAQQLLEPLGEAHERCAVHDVVVAENQMDDVALDPLSVPERGFLLDRADCERQVMGGDRYTPVGVALAGRPMIFMRDEPAPGYCSAGVACARRSATRLCQR